MAESPQIRGPNMSFWFSHHTISWNKNNTNKTTSSNKTDQHLKPTCPNSSSCVDFIASGKQTKLQSYNFTNPIEHWYCSDGYYFQRSDKLRKISEESLLGACANIKIFTVAIVAQVLPPIIITAVQQNIMVSGIWTGTMSFVQYASLGWKKDPWNEGYFAGVT